MNRSKIVLALANLASQGVYNGVTPQGARNMNKVFEDTADLVNALEQEEEEDRKANEELTNEGGPVNE